MAREQKFIIFRQDNETAKPRYERYTVPLTSGMTILEALFYIQDHFDPVFQEKFRSKGIKGDSSIWENSNILLNGKNIKKLNKLVLHDGDKIELLPKIAGG